MAKVPNEKPEDFTKPPAPPNPPSLAPPTPQPLPVNQPCIMVWGAESCIVERLDKALDFAGPKVISALVDARHFLVCLALENARLRAELIKGESEVGP